MLRRRHTPALKFWNGGISDSDVGLRTSMHDIADAAGSKLAACTTISIPRKRFWSSCFAGTTTDLDRVADRPSIALTILSFTPGFTQIAVLARRSHSAR